MKKTILISAMLFMLTATLTIFSCSKHSATTTVPQTDDPVYSGISNDQEYQTMIQSQVYPFNLMTSPPELVWSKDCKILGYRNTNQLHQLPFQAWVAFDKLVTGRILAYPLDDLTNDQLNTLPVEAIKAHNNLLQNAKQEQTGKNKVYRVPDCKVDPQVCPCVNTDTWSNCIELDPA